MPISQPNSALARTDAYIREALIALNRGDLTLAAAKLGGALGAAEFAGNSQTKLIEAARAASSAMAGYRDWRTSTERNGLVAAIKHAEGPGID